jgi:hypothetical protein
MPHPEITPRTYRFQLCSRGGASHREVFNAMQREREEKEEVLEARTAKRRAKRHKEKVRPTVSESYLFRDVLLFFSSPGVSKTSS